MALVAMMNGGVSEPPGGGHRALARGVIAAGALLALCAACTGTGASHRSARSVTASAPAPVGAASNSADGTACRVPSAVLRPHLDQPTLARMRAVVLALAGHAWNPAAPIAKGAPTRGGVFVNWRAAWNGRSAAGPATNIATSGVSDADAGTDARHDPLADLIILRDIDGYLATGARDDSVVQLECRLRPIVAGEFNAYGVDRGWIYSQLIDLSELDDGGPWLAAAQHYADLLSRGYIDPVTGAEREPRTGDYRSDYAAETAAALVDAGHRFGRPDWVAQGSRAARYLVMHAADAGTGLYAGELHVNATASHDDVVDPLVKVGAQAQLLDSLLSVYDETRDVELLDAVQRSVAALDNPSLGVADNQSGGYYYALNASGTGVRTEYKETRQAWMLPLFQRLQHDSPDGSARTEQFAAFVRDGLFRPTGQGYVYRVAPDLRDYTSSVNGATLSENWISSEATGIALDALMGSLS